MTQHLLHTRRVRPGILLMAGVALAAMSLALPAWANGPHPKRNDQYKHQVERLEQAWRQAQLNDDTDAMDKLLSEDYVGITMSGQVVTKTQQLDRMKARNLVLTKIELTDVKVKLIGTIAVVTSLADVDGTNEGAPMHGTYRYTRVYSRLPSGNWKITNFEATRVGPPPEPGARRGRAGNPPYEGNSPPGRNPPPDQSPRLN